MCIVDAKNQRIKALEAEEEQSKSDQRKDLRGSRSWIVGRDEYKEKYKKYLKEVANKNIRTGKIRETVYWSCEEISKNIICMVFTISIIKIMPYVASSSDLTA